jgi:hypothetical protein
MPTPDKIKQLLAHFSTISTKEKKGGGAKKQKTRSEKRGRGALSLDDLGIDQAQLQKVLSLGQADIALKQLAEANPDVKGGFGELAVTSSVKDLKKQKKIKKNARRVKSQTSRYASL